MASTDQLLQRAAQDGTWDSDLWPRVLEDLLERLDKIVLTEFPIPVLPREPAPQQTLSQGQLGSPSAARPSSQGSQASSNKENAPVKTKSPARASSPTPQPAAASSSSRPPVPSFSEADDTESTLPADYPPDLAALHKSIKSSLRNGFPRYPPHTVQRLAELILFPRRHYRFLPSYLHALDRVVNVQSSTRLFPLPQASLPISTGVLNGASAVPAISRHAPELGSDESLGGALLTPIPWLVNRTESQRSTGSSSAGSSGSQNDRELQTSSTEMVDGPNGAGRIETVNVVNGVMTTVASQPALGLGDAGRDAESTGAEEGMRADGAVTQGELLRQEQEAGVVPLQRRGLRLTEEEMSELPDEENSRDEQNEDEQPHARGPDIIGHEDIGPQDRPIGGALDLEAAVGRRGARETSLDPEDASLSDAGGGREDDMRDADGDGEDTSGAAPPVDDMEAASADLEIANAHPDSEAKMQDI
ncbi:uncharacterized protein PV09_00506 [Verruconis gallopava]|uniref:Protein phosphatase 4 core regulatory subunit R2 n=1 Tax=Verruconis gallopava TaxID=253628 RepID=A0A0D2APE1_9PEZI|nr:uncharacterized protein PV09_00506 [Verruconis gallopava]KIW08538.1 hypothetical protein PV09_00506 [Verruconis gallopava]